MRFARGIEASFEIAMIACGQFAILSMIAMILYTGGTAENPNSPGYSIVGNLLSDLGRLTAYSGASNVIASVIYNASLLLLGFSLNLFFLSMPRILSRERDARLFAYGGSVIGVFMSCAIIGGSLTPADVFLEIHLAFGALAFISGLPLATVYALALFLDTSYPRLYLMTYLVFAVIQLSYLTVMFTEMGTGQFTVLFTAGQKFAVFSLVACFLIQSYGARKKYRALFGAIKT